MAASAIRIKFILISGRFATATYENATPDMVAAEIRISQAVRTDQGMVQTREIINFEVLST